MATVVIPLKFRDADATPNATFPGTQLAVGNGAGSQTNAFPLQVGVFYDSVLSGCVWTVTPNVVGTPALTVVIDWFHPTSLAAGNVFFGVQVAALAANVVPLTKALATVTTAAGAVNTTAIGARVRTSISITANNDGFAAAVQPLFVKLTRDGTSASDTAVGDIWVFGVNVNYSDT